ncbi:alpha/beta fold hydrolase [uncultured Amnibacterium sp.]|uniref:alpha/beta fold hydrolase n=1 Tax=uncultured Amnibacterium sp. TaxID=1631851 RepID=UPI0035CB90FC
MSQAPAPQVVMATDDARIATYDVGDPAAPAILAVHGFASSAQVNWFATGWVRELTRAGFRVIAIDQRGHGRSDKPHDPAAYSMQQLVADVAAVLDAYLLDEVGLVGYSLGARVGWHAALGTEHRILKAVLGGIPDGLPLTRFRVDQALAHLERGAEVDDRITRAYLDMAARTPDNDLAALVALVGGLQGGLQPDPSAPPRQPVLFATGSEDGIIAASRRLAAATPSGEFFEIPGRNHFNAPTARPFRDRALAFLGPAPQRTPEVEAAARR